MHTFHIAGARNTHRTHFYIVLFLACLLPFPHPTQPPCYPHLRDIPKIHVRYFVLFVTKPGSYYAHFSASTFITNQCLGEMSPIQLVWLNLIFVRGIIIGFQFGGTFFANANINIKYICVCLYLLLFLAISRLIVLILPNCINWCFQKK